jgi:glycerophosphoryl diester phosphodiesterase
MNKIFLSVLVFCMMACASSKHNGSKMANEYNPVIAHRGAYKQNGFPENSIAALKEAIRLQCWGSEFDVWMTADDSLVIHHDPDYNDLLIEKTNFAALREFPLANREPLPSLREYLLAGMTNNTTTKLILEIKPSKISKERGVQVADKVVALVNQLNCASLIVYISFDYAILKRIHDIEPGAITQYLNGDKAPSVLKPMASVVQIITIRYSKKILPG